MNDAISRQAVKELAHKQVREKYCGAALKEHRDFYIKLADSIIDLLPPIQPEIVRCKDCRYYNSEEKECLDLLGHGRRWEEDDFCSYAERREVTT